MKLPCEECTDGQIEVDCPECNGSGTVEEDCPTCGGTGEVGVDDEPPPTDNE